VRHHRPMDADELASCLRAWRDRAGPPTSGYRQVVAANPMAVALMGDSSGAPPRERNVLWRHFSGAASRVALSPQEDERFEREAAADLRDALGRYPDDEPPRALVEDLRALSPRFAGLWEQRPVAPRAASRKTIVHPEIGPITLDCDVLRVADSDLRLIVYTAAPGSPEAGKLALLGAVGLQSFSA